MKNPYVIDGFTNLERYADEFQKMVGEVPMIFKTFKFTKIKDMELLKASLFIRDYLYAYQNLKFKKNFDEVKSYITEIEKNE